MSSSEEKFRRQLAVNRKARFDYHVLDRIEAGMVLNGTEVKAIRDGKIQLRDSFVEFRDREPYLVGAHVSPYRHGNRFNHDPLRARKLLLNRREIDRLAGKVEAKGLTIVPLSVYLKGDRLKVEIALVQGKKTWDKRETIRQRDLDREAREALKTAQRTD